jgi:hypothetical protein
MSFRALAALACLLVALAAERCGYYAFRSTLTMDLTRNTLSAADALVVYKAFTLITYGAAFGGGGLAFTFGPRVTAVFGAIISSVGAFALAADATAWVGCLVLGVGAGIFKACPYACAAELIADEDGGARQGFLPSGRRFASFATFAVLTYGAINLGAFIAPLLAGTLRATRDAGGFASTYAFAGAVDVLAALLAGGALFLASATAKSMADQAHAPYRAPDGAPNPAPLPPSSRTNDVFLPLTLLGVVFAAMHLVIDQGHPDRAVLGLATASYLFTINPLVVLLMTVPCGALFFVLALQRSAVPLTRVLGAGLAVFALGALLALLAVVIATCQPLPTSPRRFSAETWTSLKKISLNSDSPVICRSGRTSTPGACMSTIRYVRPAWRDDSGSERVSRMQKSAMCANDDHTFCPFTTKPPFSSRALVRTPARSEPAPGSEKPWHQISSDERSGCR